MSKTTDDDGWQVILWLIGFLGIGFVFGRQSGYDDGSQAALDWAASAVAKCELEADDYSNVTECLEFERLDIEAQIRAQRSEQ